MRLRLAAALWLVAAPSSSDIEVAVRGDRVVVNAVSAPLAEVLSRFARVTGAEVVYEAARPRQLVTIHIEAETAGEALTRILEGQGVNYALRLDPGGRRVEMLVVTGSSGTEVASTPSRGSRRSSPLPEPPVDDTDFSRDEALLEGAPPSFEPGGDAGDPAGTAAQAPWQGPPAAATGTPPLSEPTGPSSEGPSQPQAPFPASYPASPAPVQPVYPAPASHPEPD